MARASLLSYCFACSFCWCLSYNFAFVAISKPRGSHSQVALGPKFLKDLGLEKPDWLPEFSKSEAEEAPKSEGSLASAENPSLIGSAMPEISLPNQNNQTVAISSFRSEEGFLGFGGKAGKPVVLFFFAGSASPSCTKEAQAFRDRYAEFQSKGAEVIGISKDNVEFQKEWKEKEDLPFDLLSDEGGKAREMLGIPKDLFGFLEGRQTYVVGTDGAVKMIFNDQFGPEKHVDEALAAI
mmetsp:Transcript_33259/g.60274  ORF Transcript_33259/g.60274 Transcript_33259/m.60274 type:complete len:238 (+) Transcript_33259:47-760(+)